MSDLNVGVIGIKTKAELKRRLAAGEDIAFYVTDAFSNVRSINTSAIPYDTCTLYVVGPDPYKNRKWYATVERTHGKVVVK